MKASLRALLSRVIDYAGLFPPAELPLDVAIRTYARHRDEPEAWMLGRLICPAGRLRELTPYVNELFAGGRALTISALGRGGQTSEEFISGFGRDVEAIIEFERALGSRVEVSVLETRLPQRPEIGFDFDSDRLALFFEATSHEDWPETIRSAIAVARRSAHRCGFKLRTGGVEATAFPPSEQIAFALVACREAHVPIKFTAGLHHPIRHFNRSVNTTMHGFVNVLAAGVLAHANNLPENELVAILNDQDPGSFVFDDERVRWRDVQATTSQIALVRQDHVISFGSCSFDEPRDDLRAMGWL